MKLLFLFMPILAFAQDAPEATINVQLQNLAFYQDQTGDVTRYGTSPNITPVDVAKPLQQITADTAPGAPLGAELSPGTAALQLNGAYLPGLPFNIPIR